MTRHDCGSHPRVPLDYGLLLPVGPVAEGAITNGHLPSTTATATSASRIKAGLLQQRELVGTAIRPRVSMDNPG